MPAPLGWFVPASVERSCSEESGLCSDSAATLLQLATKSAIKGLPQPCMAGYVGNSTKLAAQVTPSCAGACGQGNYCPEGSAAPIACPPGKFGTSASAFSESACSPCPRGALCTAGAVAPTYCEAGTYQNEFGQSACKQCDSSSVCLGVGLIEATASPCPQGYFFEALNRTTCTVELCCHICPVASACDGRYKRPCPPGSHSTQTGEAHCTQCPAGTFMNLNVLRWPPPSPPPPSPPPLPPPTPPSPPLPPSSPPPASSGCPGPRQSCHTRRSWP